MARTLDGELDREIDVGMGAGIIAYTLRMEVRTSGICAQGISESSYTFREDRTDEESAWSITESSRPNSMMAEICLHRYAQSVRDIL